MQHVSNKYSLVVALVEGLFKTRFRNCGEGEKRRFKQVYL